MEKGGEEQVQFVLGGGYLRSFQGIRAVLSITFNDLLADTNK